jgi:glycosyltransferase involved in cell wall biosynthesis
MRLVYRRLIWDGSARRATLVMANSEATRREIETRMRVPADRVRVVLEAVDDRFSTVSSAEAGPAVRIQYGLQRPYVLYVSNLWHYKNPDGAIRAFGKLRARYADDLDLVIAGPDDYGRLPQLKALAKECGVADRVRFLGRVPLSALLQLYGAARVLFYPSMAETFGKPVVEGMLARVPVVAANRTSLPEMVGDAGLLVDPGDLDAMAEAVHRAATDEDLRRTLVSRGIARARQFTWSRTARGTLNACEEAVTLHRRRPS